MAGAPIANLNGTRNAAQLSALPGRVARLPIGCLPKPLRRVQSAACRYRRTLEAAVFARHKGVDDVQSHLINEAVYHEIHAGICRWLLNSRLETMATADVVACSKAMTTAKKERNKVVRDLGLETTREDIIQALYSPCIERSADTSEDTSEDTTCPPGDASADAEGAEIDDNRDKDEEQD